MARHENTHVNLRKLKRLELVEMLYALRKENILLEEKCELLEKRIEEIQSQRDKPSSSMQQLEWMTQIVGVLCKATTGIDLPMPRHSGRTEE